MIHDEICTCEVAKLAKKKGFREKCIAHYYDDTKDLYRSSNPQCYNWGGNTSDAPTQSLLQRWMREDKGVCIAIYPNLRVNHSFEWIGYKKDEKCWTPVVSNMKEYNTYELALEDALKYALEKLVN